jgi:hypothetical protein
MNDDRTFPPEDTTRTNPAFERALLLEESILGGSSITREWTAL